MSDPSSGYNPGGIPPPSYHNYPTELPSTFDIGQYRVAPLVNVTELQAHLCLLGAFHKLKQDVQNHQNELTAISKDQAWVVFVNRAVYRFYLWLSSPRLHDQSVLASSEESMPPLDVLMVWHAYTLNPRTYYEDGFRMAGRFNRSVQMLSSFPVTLAASLIDPFTFDPYPPSLARGALFTHLAGVRFEWPISTSSTHEFEILCSCCYPHAPHNIPWWNAHGRGYAQPGFLLICKNTGMKVTRETMGVRRFCEEVAVRDRGATGTYFSETLLNPYTGTIDYPKADEFCRSITKNLRSGTGTDVGHAALNFARGINFDRKTLAQVLSNGAIAAGIQTKEQRSPRIWRVTQAYTDPGAAGVELVGAVLRQGDFVQKMVNLGWTASGRFEDPASHAPLVRCIARYHAFLFLFESHPGAFFVPTLDIDLAWHSHQLNAKQYRQDTATVVSRTPNHEDSIAQEVLSASYDRTAKAWKATFGVPYSVCGCVPDVPKTDNPVQRLASKILKKNKDKEPLGPPPVLQNARPDLVSTDDVDADASHPSEHNLELGNPDGRAARRMLLARQHTAKIRYKAGKEACGTPKTYNPWTALQVERNERNVPRDGHKEAFTSRTKSHDYYPYWGVTLFPAVGFYGGLGYTGIGGCGGGNVGGSACATGGCGGGAGGGGGGGDSGGNSGGGDSGGGGGGDGGGGGGGGGGCGCGGG